MSMTGAFHPDPADDLDWSVAQDAFVIHYSTHVAHHGRPLWDWIALFSAGVALTIFVFSLMFLMALYPIS